MCHVTRGILVPWPWIEPGPPVLGAQSIKTTGSRGKSRSPDFWALSWNPRWLPSSLLVTGPVWVVLSLWNPGPDLTSSLPDHGAGPTPPFPKGQVVASYSSCPSWSAECVPFWLLLRVLRYPQFGLFCGGCLLSFLSVVLLEKKHISLKNSSWLDFVNRACIWSIVLFLLPSYL